MFAPVGQTTVRAGLRSKLAALVVRRQADPRLAGGVLDAPPLSLIALLRQKVRRHRGQDRGHDTRNRNRKPAHGTFDLAHL